MATYENVSALKNDGENMIHHEASTHNSSMAVSNEMYGALNLEPTIPSSRRHDYEELDDFWLELAKGQTTKHNHGNKAIDKRCSNSNIWPLNLDTAKHSSTKSFCKERKGSVNDGFVSDAGWEYSTRNDAGNCVSTNENFLYPKNLKTSLKQPESKTCNTTIEGMNEVRNSDETIIHTNSETTVDENNLYSLACAIDEVPQVVKEKRHYTAPNSKHEYVANPSINDYQKAKTLNQIDHNEVFLPPLCDKSIYESVDDLSVRMPMPLPVDIPETSSPVDPVYATVVKKKKNQSYSATDSPDIDGFYSLAEKRLHEQSDKIETDKNCIEHDPLYAKVNKPKRYINWPLSESIKKRIENPKAQHSDSASILNTEDDNPPVDLCQYSSIEDVENLRSHGNETLYGETLNASNLQNTAGTTETENPVKSETSKVTLKDKMKDFFSSKKTRKLQPQKMKRHEKSHFYPFSFIYNFSINIKGQGQVSVKKILPYIDGKCWIMCECDLSIRLYDSQGQESESFHIGLEGIDMTFDTHGHLFVSCKNTRRIFVIDLRNLCQMSSFVDTNLYPSGLAFDLIDNTLIVCQNQHGTPVGVAPLESIQKYNITGSSRRARNLTSENLFSYPLCIVKNSHGGIVVSDFETKSITILHSDGQLKARFTGTEDFKLYSEYTFTCDLQSNVLVLSQGKFGKANNDDNVCLLDDGGNFIDTFFIEEIRDQKANTIAITDLGFVWIGCDTGIYIFDYQLPFII